MKRIVQHPPREERPKMWRSLGELENRPDFQEWLHREFPRGAGVYEDSGVSRRDFVKLMGASMALAGVGLSACRRPEAYLVPFRNGVEWTVPGKFLYYATSMPTRKGSMPLIATTSDGRPTKLEGNPIHPASNGGTDGFAQASVLDLYDPHRSKEIKHKGEVVSPEDLQTHLAAIRARYQGKGQGFAVLSGRVDSPTRDRLRAKLAAEFPGMVWAEYEPLGSSFQEQALTAAFGPGVAMLPRTENADILLALDSDFLNCNEAGLNPSRGFSRRRKPDQTDGRPMNRLYVVENHYSLTGGMADHRLRVKASAIPDFTIALAQAVAQATGNNELSRMAAAAQSGGATFDPVWIKECAEDLVQHRGRSLVLVGDQQPVQTHLLALGINQALDSFGTTIDLVKTERPESASITEIANGLQSGSIETLLILGGNPAYDAPADLDFASLLSKAKDSLHWSLFEDETSQRCQWSIPAAHYLESWGDGLSFDGLYTSVQPMILPLWNGLPELDLLATLAGLEIPEGPQLVKETFARRAGVTNGSLDAAWNEFLRVGFLPGDGYVKLSPGLNAAAVNLALSQAGPVSSDGMELVFIQSSSTDDGRYGNNSWLQETPDFVTKLTWDNALLVSPADAAGAGWRDEDLVTISAQGVSIEAAVMISPGHAEGSCSLALGYGREGVSALLDGVGFNAYPLRQSQQPRFRNGVSIAKTGKKYSFAQTQEHYSMEGRDLAREGTLERFRKEPNFVRSMGEEAHLPPLVLKGISLYRNPVLTAKEQWAMAVDLNVCTGCNACLLACQAENNVPVVGKDQVRRGRHMGWIRIDRWFAGEPENPEMVAMGILCQQCENAPCETVCPVNATVHSEDGLNLMAYNRCIGTRYCANNCPWKVRRFNYFDYNQRPLDKLYWGPVAPKGMADSLKMVKNPNVTVRMRGVMEKCTFCIQRIEEAKIGRLVEAGASNSSEVPVGPFKTACQQVCPSDAIVFGNENDPDSAVAKQRANERGYVMFEYLNVRPRVTYLARIKNPNMKMPGAELVGHINSGGHHPEEHSEMPTGASHGAEVEA
jgi:MoCo/4Fe-4S cofactor protein with predicted Tat translocation signal